MGARPRICSRWLLLLGASLALGCSPSDDPPNFTVMNDAGGACGLSSCADAGPRGGSKAPPPRGGGGSTAVDPIPPKKPDPTPPPPVPVCTPQVPLAPLCAGCACTATPECATAVTECDESCWAMLSCAYEHCLPSLDAKCLETECPEHDSAIESALAAISCTSRCYGNCLYDLQRLGMDDMDAGL